MGNNRRFKFKKPCKDCEKLFRPEGVGHTSKFCEKCLERRHKEKMKKLKQKKYGFTVQFKNRVSKKERNRIMELVLHQKSVDSIQGAITIKKL